VAQSERSANEFVVLLRKKHSITLDRRRSALDAKRTPPRLIKSGIKQPPIDHRNRVKKNEYDRATRDYDEAIRLEPNLEAVWDGRCWARAILGALQAALEDCNKALQSGPNNAATYDSRGLIYLKMGQLDAAIDDFNSALRFDPTLASALYGRGLAKFRKGDKAGSDTDISAAKTIQAPIGDNFMRYGVK
jgi:tetratricopeptide (TPR) repeat protein